MTDAHPASATPADWYPDPSGAWDYRYWNGRSWTAHVSRAGVAYVDPQTAHLPTGEQQAAEPVVGPVAEQVAEPVAGPVAEQQAEPEAEKEQGFLGRLLTEHREEKAEREEVEQLVRCVGEGDDRAAAELPQALQRVSVGWLDRERRWSLFAEAARRSLDDDVLAAPEAQRLDRLAELLGVDTAELGRRQPELFEELLIGQINDGRLPVVAQAPILTRRGETVHGVFRVELLKEREVRGYVGGSNGFSVALGHGVRYRVGAFRGHSAVLGTELVPQDEGVLVVTSSRTVFSGQRRTRELRHDRLLDLEQFSDGLRFNVSGRETTSLFRFREGSSPAIAAALVAAARNLSSRRPGPPRPAPVEQSAGSR
ncbi:MAG TPA: DUF2510 domain-containing protein [Marmoricola sp.]